MIIDGSNGVFILSVFRAAPESRKEPLFPPASFFPAEPGRL